MSRWVRRFIIVMLFGSLASAAAYVQSEGFSVRWRSFVADQFEKHGVYITLEKLTLNPLEGLVAQRIDVYQDQAHQTHLASVDRLSLDINYSKLLQKEPFIESLDLRNASVSVAIDPQDATSEKIDLSGLNARLFIVGDRVDIRKAEGWLFGLHVSITGSIVQPPASHDPDEERKERERSERRIAAIRARRSAIEEAAKLLKHFEATNRPMLSVEVNGDLSRPEEMIASLHLSAGGLRHGAYVCDELVADAVYAAESIDLTRLYLKDRLGELDATATYRIGAPTVDFHLRSGVDIPALASAVFDNESLREVVFYDPVDLSADGQAFLGDAAGNGAFVPVNCTGELRAGRFTSRGAVMDGLGLKFGLSPQGCYFRDVLLRHKTGTLGLQAMWHQQYGLKYRAEVRMDPHVFLPFLPFAPVEEIINRFKFREESSIFAQMAGEGPSLDFGQTQNHGQAEFRNFKYQGAEFVSAQGEVEVHAPVHSYRHIKVQRAEGKASTEEVSINEDTKMLKLINVVSDCDPVTLVRCFAPDVAANIAQYRFDKHPHAEMTGVIGLDDHPGTAVKVKFRSEGTAHYVLWDDDYTVHKPAGELQFTGSMLKYDVNGVAFGKDFTCKGNTNLDEKAHDYTVNFKGGQVPYPIFSKPLMFGGVRVNVVCHRGIADFDIKSSLMDGTVSMKGTVDDRGKSGKLQPYRGEVRFDALSFKKFTQTYSPDYDSEGDLTGHFEFSGKLGDWRSLEGRGALVILNSNLYAVPILGPLTPLLGALLPRPINNFNLAKEADATFTVANGFAETKDVVALTGVFRIVANGKVDFLEDRVKFYAQAKMRGLPGLVLFPVSEILEYVGEGSVSNPGWRPRFFSESKEKSGFRKPNGIPRAIIEPPDKPDDKPQKPAPPSAPTFPSRPFGR